MSVTAVAGGVVAAFRAGLVGAAPEGLGHYESGRGGRAWGPLGG